MVPAALAVLIALVSLSALARCKQLIFNEDFNTLDETRWHHLNTAWRGGNDEFQYYRNNRNNSYVRGGILHIKPTLTSDQYGEDFVQHGKLVVEGCNMQPCEAQAGVEVVQPVQSARIHTHKSFSFQYGRVEVRAKMPKGDWLWPAIWLMPEDDEYGAWPRSGEIDMMETRGNTRLFDQQGKPAGIRLAQSTLHFGKSATDKSMAHFTKIMNDDTLANDFHVYSLDWSEKGLRFSVDNQVIGEQPAPPGGFWNLGRFHGKNFYAGHPMAPFDKKYYLILNLAVGGAFFPEDLRNEPYPQPWKLSSGKAMRQFWDNRKLWEPTWKGEATAMQVDYVRVYKN